MILGNPRVGEVFRGSEREEAERLPKALMLWRRQSFSQSTWTSSVRLHLKSAKGCMQSFGNSLEMKIFWVTRWASVFGKMGMTPL